VGQPAPAPDKEAIRAREPELAEAPAEPSKLWAPSGLFPTAEDRARQAGQRAGQRVGSGSDGG
jgi:hypothetical protein